jgi:hypothetical protein
MKGALVNKVKCNSFLINNRLGRCHNHIFKKMNRNINGCLVINNGKKILNYGDFSLILDK